MKRILAPIFGTAFLLCLGLQATEAAVITCAYGTSVVGSACTVDDESGGANGGTQGLGAGTSAQFRFDPDEAANPFAVDYTVTLTFAGIVNPSDFSVTMEDIVPATPNLANFQGHVCVPIFNLTSCVEFKVSEVDELPGETWLGSYEIEILWEADTENNGFPNGSGNIRVLHANGIEGDDIYDSDITVPGSYDACPPTCPFPDPVITGADDNFTLYTVTAVPEPASGLLLATGVATLLYRRRRR